MRIQVIASVVLAALLTTGTVTATQVAEYGEQPTQAVVQQQEAQPETKELTKQEAMDIALAHAKLTEDQVTGLRGSYDRDRSPEWDIEFRHGDWEYDYEIHAETGEVRKWEREYDPSRPAPTEPAETESPVVEQPPKQETETKRLTAEEAEALALKHAGLTADQVRGLRSEFDYDDGAPEWEVEFRYGEWEYDYELHAETGKLRSWDKDRDD